MEFHGDPEILAIFRDAGCDVRDTRVRFEPGFCRSTIQATAPRQFTQHARNPANDVQLGGNATVLCPSWGPPFVHDLDRGRRYASHADFVELVKLHQTLPWLHHSGGVVCEPVDLPANKRHLDMLYAHIRWSDRAFMGAFIGAERAGHAIDMARILFGADFVAENPVLYCVSNTNAPLVLDQNMSGALKTYARANQPVACTPWVLTGAMSPTTVAGHAGAGPGGGHGLPRAGAAHQSRRALPHGQLRLHHVHAVGCTHLRHAGSGPDGAGGRPARPPPRRAAAHGGHAVGVQASRCAEPAGGGLGPA